MAVLDCNIVDILKGYEEHIQNAPLAILRQDLEAKYGKEKGFDIFFDILLLNYFHDYEILKKYRHSSLSTFH